MLSHSSIRGVFILNGWFPENNQGGNRKVKIIKLIIISQGID